MIFLNVASLEENKMKSPNRTLKQKAYQGMKEYVVISCYLYLIFGLLVLHTSVILGEHRIPFVEHGLALINALALAKVLLVARELHFADSFKDALFIYPTLFQSAAFAVLLGCFKILEEALVGWYYGEPFSNSINAIGGGTLKGILS